MCCLQPTTQARRSVLHPGNELLGATCSWVARACVQLAGRGNSDVHLQRAVGYLEASLEQLQLAYPPESVARALQGLTLQRVAGGGWGGKAAAHIVAQHHFGDAFLYNHHNTKE